MIKTFVFLLWVCLIGQICSSFAYGQSLKKSLDDECKERHIKKLIASLDPTNPLRLSLESGDRGTLDHQVWMDKMASLSIRQASYTIFFLTGTEPLKVKIISSNYYYNYFDFDAPISEMTRKRMQESGLDDELAKVATDRAVKQTEQIIIDFRRQYSSLAGNSKTFCGKIFVNLLDDEALPTLEKLPTIETKCQ